MGTETQPPVRLGEREDEATRPSGSAPGASSPSRWRARGPQLALATVVLLATIVYGSAAQLVSTPRVHPDEHIYAGGGASLAEGEGLTLRGEEYGLGPVYPVVLAGVLTVAQDRETAYAFYKVANALLFALAAIPIFLLARRLLSPWWSVGVAGLSLAIPSSMYVAVVMTESTAYLTYSLTVYAIVLALERPTVVRQLAVLGAVGLAYATRAQFAVLFGAYLLGLVLCWAIRTDRPRVREALVGLWPSLAALALGLVVFLVKPLATGESPVDSIGAYAVLFRGYDPFEILRWGLYHVADLEVYLAVVPLAVSPIVLWLLWGRARAGSERSAAFLTTFVTVNAAMLFVTAAFSSTEFGFDRLHDRNVFYLAPLWLIVLAVWLAEGLPRPLVATAIGAVLALALPLLLPFRYIAGDVGVDVVPSALWARLEEQLTGEVVTARKLLALLLVALLVAVAVLPRRLRWVFPAVLLASFAVTAVLAWERIADAEENKVFAGGYDKSWIDDRLPDDARVTKLYLDSAACPTSALTRHALYLTEFFNARVERAAYIDDSIPDGLPIERVDVGPGGQLIRDDGTPLVADYVYTQPGLALAGEKVASGTSADLVLWRIGGPVTVPGARTNADLRTTSCPAT
jgi:hypothetical protein